MNKYSLTKLSNFQISVLKSMSEYLQAVVKGECECKESALKNIAENIHYMAQLAEDQAKKEELQTAHDGSQWYECMEQACKDCFFYEQMVKNDIDIPESQFAWECAYEVYERILKLGTILKLNYFLKPMSPKEWYAK